jgi:hypothetical protein
MILAVDDRRFSNADHRRAAARGSRSALRLVALDLRPFVQDRIEERMMHFDFSVVADEALLAELVHEETDA